MNRRRHAATLALALAALGAMGFRCGADEPPVALYVPATRIALRHRIEKGQYVVVFEFAQALTAPESGVPAKFATTVRVPVPEPGAFERPQALGGAFAKATVALDGTTLVLTVTHQPYRPPSPAVVAALAATEAGLAPTLDAIARGWNGDAGRKLQGALLSLAHRGQGIAAHRQLLALAHAYAGQLADAAALGESPLRDLAKLIGVDTAGSVDALAARLAAAIGGARLLGRFIPDPATSRLPTRGAAAGEVGRAVLRGVIQPDEVDDWWELEVPPGIDVAALEIPVDLAWFVVEDAAEPTKLRIRVHARTTTPLGYALLLKNPHGSDARSIEIHERPPDLPGVEHE